MFPYINKSGDFFGFLSQLFIEFQAPVKSGVWGCRFL